MNTEQDCVIKELSFEERINFLKYCASRYENYGDSPISDEEYDEEYYDLKSENPGHSFFKEVGGKISTKNVLVKHDIVMGSLSKARDLDEFRDWLKSVYPKSRPSFSLQHKIDGLALSLIYENGYLQKAITRGDGYAGMDVTKNVQYIDDIPKKLAFSPLVEIRGEVYKEKEDFYKRWHVSVGGEYKNPRAFASGSLNQPKNPAVTKERNLSFVAYNLKRVEFETVKEQNEFLKSHGFPVVSTYISKPDADIDVVVKGVEKYMNNIDRKNLPYDIDGVVVKNSNIKQGISLGYTDGGKKPKSDIAVKFKSSTAETILIGVEANVGRTGNVTPVAILKPVELDGAEIARCTLHNYGMLREGNIGIGSKVVIAKKGDIIPQIIKVLDKGDSEIVFPTHCPSCGTLLEWDENKVNLVCTNEFCKAKLSKRIEYWFKKLGSKGLGPGIINRIVDNLEKLNSLGMFYQAFYSPKEKATTFLEKEFGSKAKDNIIASIQEVKEVTLEEFIQALGIGQIGRMSKDIVAIAPTISDLDNLTVDDIIKIDGFSHIKANNFVEGWKKYKPEVNILLKFISIKEKQKDSNKLENQKYCFTGSFSSPSRKEMEKMVEDNGGSLSSVSKNLTALVWDGTTTKGKYDKAKSLQIPIITQQEFMEKIS